ncbi:L7Ae/L30e/S12e/Gadd45 family ribosomal protein [Desulfitobacterium metallireducens]|uniref:Ribosomal protein n=1 Tax=Desulfitobacterium metallireducens DSM 15288 TaxID=871968 RepID=W0E4V2_9FIRM|nr:ribosomal L7Ae/L30e/S12e/Gadd45 family protein [Desulfitobacterium metallireducens]AHF05890.1 ribosomal protein [Desulfitobacterium metallireducens DSM 15288]
MLDETLKNSRHKTVGVKQTQRALEKGIVREVFIAKDAEQHVLRPIIESCKTLGIEMVEIPTMIDLGKACGIEVGAAVAALTAE